MTDKQTHYVFLIDEDRDHVINIMQQAMLNDASAMRYIRKNNLEKVFMAMLEEISEKSHKLGFCDDPKCEYVPPEER